MLYGQTDLEAKLVALKVYSIERDTAAGALFLNGYFNEIVKNTAKKYDDSLIPVYMRLAIMRIEITPKNNAIYACRMCRYWRESRF